MKLPTFFGILATAVSAQNKLKCDVSTIFTVHCSATNGMTIDTVAVTKEGLSVDCQALLSTTEEFEIRSSGTGSAPAATDCLLGDLAPETSFDPLANEETKCWSKSDANEELLQFSSDVYLFDKGNDIRPWPQVTLQCDILKAVTVTPISIALTYGELGDIGATSDPVSLSMKAIIDNTDTALTQPDTASLPLGATTYFFVETTLSSHLDLVLGTCTYKGDSVTAASDYVMAMSNQITTAYSFASDVAGFTMQIYQNSKANDMVQCDVTLGFASPVPVSCPADWTKFAIDGSDKCLKSFGESPIPNAKTVCADSGATVPLPRSESENNDYQSAFVSLGATGDVVIGLHDLDIEGEWRDFADNPVTYVNWNQGEPNNSEPGEHYAAMITPTSLWNDLSTESTLVICEK